MCHSRGSAGTVGGAYREGAAGWHLLNAAHTHQALAQPPPRWRCRAVLQSSALSALSLTSKVMSRKDRVVARLRGGIGFLLKKRGVQVLTGTAVLAGSKAVEVTAEGGEVTRLEARNIVIATGSEPVTPRVFGYDGDYVLTSEDVLSLKELPKRILIIGAGVIGCEFASIFRAFGCEVPVADIMPNILPMVDDDAAEVVKATFKRRGIGVHTGVKISSVQVVETRGGVHRGRPGVQGRQGAARHWCADHRRVGAGRRRRDRCRWRSRWTRA